MPLATSIKLLAFAISFSFMIIQPVEIADLTNFSQLESKGRRNRPFESSRILLSAYIYESPRAREGVKSPFTGARDRGCATQGGGGRGKNEEMIKARRRDVLA